MEWSNEINAAKKACCFTGHRIIAKWEYDRIVSSLRLWLEKFIHNGIDTFYCGGAMGFDLICGREVLKLKESFPQIKLIIAVPCADQAKKFTAAWKRLYDYVLQNADEVVTLSESYMEGCMMVRNRYMVDRCDTVLYYMTRSRGGTYYTCNYAKREGKRLISVLD